VSVADDLSGFWRFPAKRPHRRGCTELAEDRLSVPIPAVLTEGGGTLILVSAERARDFPQSDIDHPTIYGAFADLPIYGLEDLGIVPRGEAEAFIVEAPGGKRPFETNGGGLSYMHSGMVGRAAVSDAGGFRAGLSR
jgi:hypothetical protein